jgi:hypothetical protein
MQENILWVDFCTYGVLLRNKFDPVSALSLCLIKGKVCGINKFGWRIRVTVSTGNAYADGDTFVGDLLEPLA